MARKKRKEPETVDFSCGICGGVFPVPKADAEARIARFCPRCEGNLRSKEPEDPIEARFRAIEIRINALEGRLSNAETD